jgi:tetratricopeptide (TPR) repeat protein
VDLRTAAGEATSAVALSDKLFDAAPGEPSVTLERALLRIAAGAREPASELEQFFVVAGGAPVDPRVTALAESMRSLLNRRPPVAAGAWIDQAATFAKSGQLAAAWACLALARAAGADPLRMSRARADTYHGLYFERREAAEYDAVAKLRARHAAAAAARDDPGVDPGASSFWFAVGKHYFHWHLFYPARRMWERALALPGADARTEYHLARVHEETGAYAEAKALFEKAAALAGPDEFVQKARRKLAGPRYGSRSGASPAPGRSAAPVGAGGRRQGGY